MTDHTEEHARDSTGKSISPVLAAGLAWQAAGFSVVPVTSDGLKRPDLTSWDRYKDERATDTRVRIWLSPGGSKGLGLVMGAVSGAEMLELEGRAVAEGIGPRLRQVCRQEGIEPLLDRLMKGYVEYTPSGGMHFIFRIDGTPAGSQKLARRPSTDTELAAWRDQQQQQIDLEPNDTVRSNRQKTLDKITSGDQVPQVLIETRGEGGFVVIAPTPGECHQSGRSWDVHNGSPTELATLTAEERDQLYAAATALDTMPAKSFATGMRERRREPAEPTGERPGDLFNAQSTWEEILVPHGWTLLKPYGGGYAWRRPGKTDGSIAATTGTSGNDADNLYVFSTSTIFEANEYYDKFAAYSYLEHGGNFSAAAKELAGLGYKSTTSATTGPRPSGLEGLLSAEDIAALSETIAAPATEKKSEKTRAVADGGSAEHGVEGNLATVHSLQDRKDQQAATILTIVSHTDDANALMLVDSYGDKIRYCSDRGRWLAWDGARWEWQANTGGMAREYAKELARSFDAADKDDAKWKARSLSSAGTSAMLTQAATDPRITVTIDDLDAHPWELNTPAGIVDLRTGATLPSDPAKLHTRITGCAPVPDGHEGDDQAWLDFLADTFDDPDLIAYLRRLVGYSAIGYVGPHVLPFCHGSGGNGKGVFLEVLVKILGDYATTAPSGFLMATMHTNHETEIARLAGARMVLCSEVNEDDRFDEAKVKQLTGGDTLTARFMRQDHFTFNATHQLWLMGNHKPAVRSGGRSFWRRLRLIPFEREVPEEKVVDDLQGILATEHGPTILSWIIAGASEFHRDGLGEPDSVKAATADYARDQDTVTRFVEECCHIGGGPHVQIKVKIVRDAYERWCSNEGEEAVTAKALGLALKNRFGVETTRTNASRMYCNITLLTTEDGSDEPGDDRRPGPSTEAEDGWYR